jgi:uncharacterized SAM-binding protein YcdF (DUF218 family)
MYYFLSKTVGGLTSPGMLLMVFVLTAGLAALLRRRRLCGMSLALSVILVVSFGILPVSLWLAVPLETRFPSDPPLPDHVDGIIALGGTERVDRSAAWRMPELSDPEPIAVLVELARRYPDAKLVFSGGLHARDGSGVGEATIVRDFIGQLSSNPPTIAYEDRSRNTMENAKLTYELIKPRPDTRWILITEAISMPRAVGAFRKAGWTVIPFPAGHVTSGKIGDLLSFDLSGGLDLGATALHEWVGLFVYRFLGYTDQILPR